MRILVLSDSHGRVGPMEEAVEAVRPQQIFHLGDGGPLPGASPARSRPSPATRSGATATTAPASRRRRPC